MSRLILLLLALGLALWAITTLRALARAIPARKAARAGYFAASAGLMGEIRTQIQPTGFPRIAGRYRGLKVDLQALPDSLAFRKLPALWVMVTLTEPQPLRGEAHVMARPGGLESFSTHAEMPCDVALPPGFPPQTSLRCTDPAALPSEALFARIAPLFAEPRVKELVLSPKGLRLVFLAEEAERSRYLIFRDAELGRSPLAAARLQSLLAALCDLHFALNPMKATA